MGYVQIILLKFRQELIFHVLNVQHLLLILQNFVDQKQHLLKLSHQKSDFQQTEKLDLPFFFFF